MAVVLVVEDDFLTCELAEETIRHWGHETLVASDVDEALAILRSPQHIDILFTDIYLKAAVQGGCTLAREATRLRPALRVLYTTGNCITHALKGMFIEGAHCLQKPYTEPQLHARLDEMVAALAVAAATMATPALA